MTTSINGDGGMALTQESDLGSHSASVTVIVSKLFNSPEIPSFFNGKDKIMSVCCKDEIK